MNWRSCGFLPMFIPWLLTDDENLEIRRGVMDRVEVERIVEFRVVGITFSFVVDIIDVRILG